MKQVTIDNALQAIQKRFCGLASVIFMDCDNVLDIIIKDLHSGKFFEVFSNEEWTSLKIKEVELLNN